MAQARAFSHVGITVPDLDKAVDFYTKVFGWYVIMKPTEVTEDDSAIGIMCKDVFGEGFGRFRIAHMSTSDKIGVELFEWPDTVKPKNNLEYRKSGIFHFCIQDPEIEETVKKIVANGGRQRMPIREYYPGERPYRMVYMEDPFGNVFELYSHSYELTYSRGAYQD
jgi:lactoylglutathione lyase family protein